MHGSPRQSLSFRTHLIGGLRGAPPTHDDCPAIAIGGSPDEAISRVANLTPRATIDCALAGRLVPAGAMPCLSARLQFCRAALNGAHWTIATAREHLSLRRLDPWEAYWPLRQPLSTLIKRLATAAS